MRRTIEGLPAPLGITSVLLLAASLRWAHHWGQPQTVALVVAWSAVTLGALYIGFHVRGRSARFVRFGVTLGLVSVLALTIAGLAWAAGYDPAGACGGG
jgi:hypothetical protein